MTWQGGKTAREAGPASPFAPLKPLADQQDAPARALELLGEALGDFPTPVRLHVRLLAGEDGEQVEHWEVPAGSKDAKAKRAEPQDADVIVVMRPETWMQIAQGRSPRTRRCTRGGCASEATSRRPRRSRST